MKKKSCLIQKANEGATEPQNHQNGFQINVDAATQASDDLT